MVSINENSLSKLNQLVLTLSWNHWPSRNFTRVLTVSNGILYTVGVNWIHHPIGRFTLFIQIVWLLNQRAIWMRNPRKLLKYLQQSHVIERLTSWLYVNNLNHSNGWYILPPRYGHPGRIFLPWCLCWLLVCLSRMSPKHSWESSRLSEESLVVKWLPLYEMDAVTWVQILDKTAFHIALIPLGESNYSLSNYE